MRPFSLVTCQAVLVAGLVLAAWPMASLANDDGISGRSGMSGKTCTSCHSGGSTPTVKIQGPTTLTALTTGTYSVVVSGGPGAGAGLDVAASAGVTLGVVDASTTKLVNGELTHTASLPYSSGSATFPLTVTAPSAVGTITVYVAGLADNGDDLTGGDGTATTTFQIAVTPAPGLDGGGNGPDSPIITQPAAAVPSIVSSTTTALSVQAIEGGPGGDLVYTWSGPTGVSFSPNGTTSAANTTATFSTAGTYGVTVTVTDATSGQSTPSTCSVEVDSTPTGIAVTPTVATVQVSTTQQFTASLNDQFGNALPAQPLIWTVSGGGTIDANGNFTAGASPGGPVTVQASGDALSGTATVTVSNELPPMFSVQATAASTQVAGTSTTVLAQATDHAGAQVLSYTWSVLSGPSATFNPNGSNSAKTSVVTFSAVGAYVLQVAASDPEGDTATSTVTVNVSATSSSISVSPANTTVAPGGSAIFTANVLDQFGNTISSPLNVSWSVSGGGSIASTGRFLASSVVGGPYTVKAITPTLQGMAAVVVSPDGTSSSTPPAPPGPGSSNAWGSSGCTTFAPTAANGWAPLLIAGLLLRRRRG
jgi:hypothetical protein